MAETDLSPLLDDGADLGVRQPEGFDYILDRGLSSKPDGY